MAIKITVNTNGSLRVEGNLSELQVVDPQGVAYNFGGREKLSFCRCGQSSNKPLCDGSHKHHDFKDEPVARDLFPSAPNITL